MRIRKFIPPMSILLFLALTLSGMYYARLRILERHMVDAMKMDDRATVAELAHSFPCPVNARSGERGTPLHWATVARDGPMVALLLSNGADVNARDNVGRTPLHWAAAWGDRAIVEMLVCKGADVNARQADGETALRLAMDHNYDAVAEVLRKAGGKAEERYR